jgi:drug/metabolite transporter (DMT)-like permease
VVAPTAAVLTAAIPVSFNFITSGAPKTTQLAGFGVALVGIWLVSRSPVENGVISRQVFGMAILAGAGFGGFFILIAHIGPGPLFSPLVVARVMTFLTGLILLRWARLPLLWPRANPPAALAGLLDAGGNVFYLLASQFTRLDIAAVLASLYPAATVLLSSLLLKERIARAQWLGLGLCLVAIALIGVG